MIIWCARNTRFFPGRLGKKEIKDCLVGPNLKERGFPGERDELGVDGINGLPGKKGGRGFPGPVGFTGGKRKSGFLGQNGLEGFKGERGLSRAPGPIGFPGLQGFPPDRGPTALLLLLRQKSENPVVLD